MNIFENPFCILGVSTRSSRQQIASATEEKAFLRNDDSQRLNEARNTLIIPAKRLAAELRWFPGLPDERISEVVEFFRKLDTGQPAPKIATSGFKSIALLNFAVYAFPFRKFKNASEITKSLLAIDYFFEKLTPGVICETINHERAEAEFPFVKPSELDDEIRGYRSDIVKVLNGTLSSKKYAGLAEYLAEKYSYEGEKNHSMLIIGDLLDSYELHIMLLLEEQKKRVLDAADDIHSSMPDVPEKFFVSLPTCIKKWKLTGSPLLLTAKSRGTEHANIYGQYEEIFSAVRRCTIELHNKHGKTEDAKRLMMILKEYFADVSPKFAEIIDWDIEALQSILERRRQEQKEYNDWAESIYYETEFGLIFKSKFRISKDGILWKGQLTPLEAITGMSWGIIKHYTNGIPTGTEYKIFFQASFYRAEIHARQKQYGEIIGRLWRALAIPIFGKIMEQVQKGENVIIGGIEFNDNGVFLKKSGWFSSDRKFFAWEARFKMRDDNGYCVISHGEYSAKSSYMYDMNTHIFDFMMHKFFENFGGSTHKLSDLLRLL